MKLNKTIFILMLLFALCGGGCFLVENKAGVSSKENSQNKTVEVASTPVVVATPNKSKDGSVGENLEAFKPPKWFTLKEADGDIDGDGKSDFVAVFSQDNPKSEKSEVPETDGEAPRHLIIGLQTVDGKYKRVFDSSKIILCRNCGGMLVNVVPEIKIANRKIQISQNVLATSEVNYLLEIEYKDNKEFLITKAAVNNRERKTGADQTNKIKTPMALADFDINNY